MRSKLHWIGLADGVPGHPQDTGRWDTPESRGSFQQISICFLERTLAGMPTTLAVTTSQQKHSFSHPTNTDRAAGQTPLCCCLHHCSPGGTGPGSQVASGLCTHGLEKSQEARAQCPCAVGSSLPCCPALGSLVRKNQAWPGGSGGAAVSAASADACWLLSAWEGHPPQLPSLSLLSFGSLRPPCWVVCHP